MADRGGFHKAAAATAVCAALGACASNPKAPAPGAVVQTVGKPYVVNGRRHTPAHQPDYDEIGEASWYGAAHQGKPTASGETFDLRRISGAHKTLPLPSLVEVTNLQNGRRLQVRINDRGPFAKERIVDLSQAAAEALGFKAQGVARVRVRYLGSGPGNTTERPTSSGRRSIWAVQAGAFAERGNARRAAEQLDPLGRTEIRAVERDGRTLHRVLVGGWREPAQARAARSRAAALGFTDAQVVPLF